MSDDDGGESDDDDGGESEGGSEGGSVGGSTGESVVTATGVAVGVLSMGGAEGVRDGSSVCGEMVGEPSGKAGQNAGHAPPRSGS